jgi:ribosomal protein L16 Arg81 hydroxylase
MAQVGVLNAARPVSGRHEREELSSMSCRFLDDLSLSKLIAPTPEEEFRTLYWERQPLIIHRKNPDFYGDLFTLEDFDQAAMRYANYFKMANATTKKFKNYRKSFTEGLEATLEDVRAGSTLVLDQLHDREPKMGRLCRVLAAQLGHRFQTNLYLTPPNGRGFTPHFDNHDVFILQVMGSKLWKIEKQLRKYPSKDEGMDDESERELRGDLHSFVLEQGDLIYIPRGFVHAAECAAEPSLHVTLGLIGDHWDDLINATVRAAILQNEQLRHPLPLNFDRQPQALVNRLKGIFREMADASFLNGVVDQYLDEIVSHHPLDISNQIVEFFAPKPLGLDDVVGARPGIVFRMHPGEESVRVNYGARTIVFPHFFRQALEFSLYRRAFAIRDIPGDLQDFERVVFIERLIEEGLVVRRSDAQSDRTVAGLREEQEAEASPAIAK